MNKLAHGIALEVSDPNLRRQVVEYLRKRGMRIRQDWEKVVVLARGNEEETARAVHVLVNDFVATLPDQALASLVQSDDKKIMITLKGVVEDSHHALSLTKFMIADLHPFCDIGSLLALNWMRTAAASVEKLGSSDDEVIRLAVHEGLDGLLLHRQTCEICLARHSDARAPSFP